MAKKVPVTIPLTKPHHKVNFSIICAIFELENVNNKE